MMQAQWKAETQSGESLTFEHCKGGYFSRLDAWGLRVVGKTAQESLSGKNLWPVGVINRYRSHTYGYRYTMSAANVELVKNALIPGETYVYSSYSASPSYSLNMGYIEFYGADNKYLFSMHRSGKNASATSKVIPESIGETTAIYVEGYDAGSPNLTQIMLRHASTSEEYEAYNGGVPVPNPDNPKSIQCVKAGTVISCGECQLVTPCDLYEADIYYPASGRVVRYNGYIASYNGETVPAGYTSTTGALTEGATVVYPLTVPLVEQYAPTPLWAPQGTAAVTQTPVEESAQLAATMYVRR